ncbi:hypothetical protein THI4931_15650 [Pandoraea sputorum]|nr:hypothetical protein THI4931_15650 [Pandoraea sputorum]
MVSRDGPSRQDGNDAATGSTGVSGATECTAGWAVADASGGAAALGEFAHPPTTAALQAAANISGSVRRRMDPLRETVVIGYLHRE